MEHFIDSVFEKRLIAEHREHANHGADHSADDKWQRLFLHIRNHKNQKQDKTRCDTDTAGQ